MKKTLKNQVKKEYETAKKLLSGKTFSDSTKLFPRRDIINKTDELYDVNLGHCCITVLNKNGKAKLSNEVEIWDGCDCLGSYDIKKLVDKKTYHVTVTTTLTKEYDISVKSKTELIAILDDDCCDIYDDSVEIETTYRYEEI